MIFFEWVRSGGFQIGGLGLLTWLGFADRWLGWWVWWLLLAPTGLMVCVYVALLMVCVCVCVCVWLCVCGDGYG